MDRKKTKAGAILLLLGIAMTGNAQSYGMLGMSLF